MKYILENPESWENDQVWDAVKFWKVKLQCKSGEIHFRKFWIVRLWCKLGAIDVWKSWILSLRWKDILGNSWMWDTLANPELLDYDAIQVNYIREIMNCETIVQIGYKTLGISKLWDYCKVAVWYFGKSQIVRLCFKLGERNLRKSWTVRLAQSRWGTFCETQRKSGVRHNREAGKCECFAAATGFRSTVPDPSFNWFMNREKKRAS